MSQIIMALDQGTTSSRTILFDENGKLLPKQMLHWPVIIPNPAGLSRFRKKYGAASDKL